MKMRLMDLAFSTKALHAAARRRDYIERRCFDTLAADGERQGPQRM